MKNTRRAFIKLSSAGVLVPFMTDGPDGSTGLTVKTGLPREQKQQAASYEKWLWIELIGFDNTSADFGVGQFIRTTGFVPDTVSFLLASADFIHGHKGLGEEWTFPDEFCSYNARPASPERQRQAWTNRQLKGLIDSLHRHRIAVYCSFFDFFVNKKGPGRWAYEFPEIRETGRDGTSYPFVHPLKRFKDGTFYADLFVEKLKQVLLDYGFDGLHGADGYTSGRLPLNEVDYSDDMTDQFTRATGTRFPAELTGKLDGKTVLFKKRSKWIWEHKREDWIRFHTNQWASFWGKVIASVHALQKKVVFNTAWTRDPFEAIYRYGIDYRRISDLGVDGFIVEAVASAVAMEPELSDEHTKFYYNALSMVMLIKAHCPRAILRPFTQLHDTTEQYDALRHIPTFVEREIYEVANLYMTDHEGQLSRCSSGPMCCLSDSLASHEWSWLKARWDLGFADQPRAVVGATLIWSGKALDNQLGVYIKTQSWSVHKWLYELLRAGAPVAAVAPIAHLGKVRGPILLLNPDLFPDDELTHALSYKNGPVFLIGKSHPAVPMTPDIRFADPVNPDFSCAVLQTAPDRQAALADEKEMIRSRTSAGTDPASWTKSLYFVPVSTAFIKACADLIRLKSGGPQLVQKGFDDIKITTLALSPDRWRVLIGSDSIYYRKPALKMPQPIQAIEVKTSFPGVPVTFSGDTFSVRIPGRGMVILDIQL